MAKNEATNPMFFDAVNQYWRGNLEYDRPVRRIRLPNGKLIDNGPTTAEMANDAYHKNTGLMLYVDRIVMQSAGTGGDYEVTEGSSGVSLTGVVALGADESQTVEVGRYVTDLYIKQFGSDGNINVFHGNPSNR